MLISPELFLDCILLVINDNQDETLNLVKTLMTLFEAETNVNSTLDQEVTKFYIRILKTIMLNKTTKESSDELKMILLKFKSDKVLEKRIDVYNLLHDVFTSQDRLSSLRMDRIVQHIKDTLVWHQSNRYVRTMFAALNRCADLVDPDARTTELLAIQNHAKELEGVFATNIDNGSAKGLVDQINFSDKESLKRGVVKHKERTLTGIIKVGLQGLAKMLGFHNGMARGESIVFNALPHNFKSGILVSTAIWAAIYNIPLGNKGKPLIIIFSLENEAYQNMMWAFKQQYAQVNGTSPDHMTDDEICDWIHDFFGKNGFVFIIERYQPSEFGFADLVRRVKFFQNSGYEIYLTVIDYMNNMKKGTSGGSGGGNHLLVKDLYNATCNFLKSEGITLVTAHQLNRKAAEIASSGITNIVKRFGQDHLADSMDVQREVDVSIFMHIEKNHDGQKFLTLAWSKHRYVDTTPEVDKYCAYPFTPYGIRDDIYDDHPGYVRDIYVDSIINPDVGNKVVETALY